MEQITITQEEFDSLPEYSCTYPSLTTIGKRWKCQDGIYDPTCKPPYKWLIGEFVEIGKEDCVGINYKHIVAIIRQKKNLVK